MTKQANQTGYAIALEALNQSFQWEKMSQEHKEMAVEAWRAHLSGCVSMEIMHRLGDTAAKIQAEIQGLFEIEGRTERYAQIHEYMLAIIETYYTSVQMRKRR